MERSCVITCKTFNKTGNFSQISFWLNLAIGFRANGNIIFLIVYTIKFLKMYNFDIFHKILAKLHNEPD